MRFLTFLLLISLVCAFRVTAAEPSSANYETVHSIFDKYCMDCHESKDPEGNLVLENFELLMKGGESGASIVPGKSDESLLVKMIEGKIEKEGKKIVMPPGKKKKLTADEIAAIKAWIDAGANAPTDAKALVKELVVPKIAPKVQPRNAINALVVSPHKNSLPPLAMAKWINFQRHTRTRAKTDRSSREM